MSLPTFRIEIGKAEQDALLERLRLTRLPAHPYETGWSTGTDRGVLEALLDYWQHGYSWPAAEARLNGYRHHRVVVAGEHVHAVVVPAAGRERLALCILHGWPGSFIEHLRSAELLSRQGFTVVVPSLPGYGLSDIPRAPGMHNGTMAERVHDLMRALGYTRYGVQGGDIGAGVAGQIARRFTQHVAGLHLNFPSRFAAPGNPPTPEEAEYLQRMARFRDEETAYARLHGTKPQTLGIALNDSPAGLLSWILEKFWAWSDHGDDLWQTFTRDDVLTNICIYWFTGTITSAMRCYQENARAGWNAPGPIDVPTAYLAAPKEPWLPPRSMVERGCRLVRWRELARGGHFASLEQPEAFAQDVGEFFASLA
jgi:pimeloyl-ACP methyl ester carboxylesterase